MNFRVIAVPGRGAEDVVVAADGTVFTGTADGTIHRITPETGHVAAVADTGGGAPGLQLLPDGRLLVCDARRGLLPVDPDSGVVEPVVVDLAPMRFCNNAAVGADGTFYFS